MKTRVHAFALYMLVFLLSVTVACSGPKAQPLAQDSDEGKEILAAAEPMTDNLFQAMDSVDFAAFSRDFDPAMQKAVTEAGFHDIVTTLNTKVGNCPTRDVARIEKVGEYYAVIYDLHCAEEDPVMWRVVITQTEPHLISGLWYDSPKPRAK